MIDELPRIGWQRVDVAYADRQFAQRPRIGETNRADRHVAFGPFHRGLRHDADADIALDQPADGIEAAQLHAQPQRPADAVGFVGKEALDRAGAVEADNVVFEHLGKADARTAGERMVAGNYQYETVAAERERMQAAVIDGAGDDADIC